MRATHFSLWATLLAALCILRPTIAQNRATCRPAPAGYGASAPSTGTLRAAVIFVDFPDYPANGTTQDLYNEITDATALYTTMSYGKLNLQMIPHLERFYRMPNTTLSYNFTRSLTTEDHVRYIKDAINAVGKTVNFTGTNVLYILPPKGATGISFSPTAMVSVKAADGTVIGNTVTYGQDMYNRWGFKTVNHETGHTMGLPDLYPYSGGTTVQWVGGFDMMGLISGQSPDYLAYEKWQLGWIDKAQVNCVDAAGNTTHRISPVEVKAGTTKLVMVPVNSTLSVLAEVRSTLGINQNACGTGVLVYQAHRDIDSGFGPLRVIDSTPNSGGCDPSNGGELNDAPFKVGSTYNSGLGVSIAVQAKEGDDYIVQVRRQ